MAPIRSSLSSGIMLSLGKVSWQRPGDTRKRPHRWLIDRVYRVGSADLTLLVSVSEITNNVINDR